MLKNSIVAIILSTEFHFLPVDANNYFFLQVFLNSMGKKYHSYLISNKW